MNGVLSSPLLASLLLVAGVCILLLGVPYIIPLPGESSRAISFENIDDERPDIKGSLDYEAALERPLFHANRLKPVEEVIVAAPVVLKRVEAPYSLVGIMGSSEANRSAYLVHEDDGATVAVKTGDQAGDWYVNAIGKDFIALVLGKERRVIKLADGG